MLKAVATAEWASPALLERPNGADQCRLGLAVEFIIYIGFEIFPAEALLLVRIVAGVARQFPAASPMGAFAALRQCCCR